jgi:hypothetical protein
MHARLEDPSVTHLAEAGTNRPFFFPEDNGDRGAKSILKTDARSHA